MHLISIKNLPENATMAHVMVEIGVFPSITQARKNGWDKPIVLGDHQLTKKKIHVRIVDEILEVKEKEFRWDLEPGFWPNYIEQNPISKAIEMPIYEQSIWINCVLNAYRKMPIDRSKKSD